MKVLLPFRARLYLRSATGISSTRETPCALGSARPSRAVTGSGGMLADDHAVVRDGLSTIISL
jgi:hypothetical protein